MVKFCVLEGRPRGAHGLSYLLAINKQFKQSSCNCRAPRIPVPQCHNFHNPTHIWHNSHFTHSSHRARATHRGNSSLVPFSSLRPQQVAGGAVEKIGATVIPQQSAVNAELAYALRGSSEMCGTTSSGSSSSMRHLHLLSLAVAEHCGGKRRRL